MVSTKTKKTNQSKQSTSNPVNLGYYYRYYESVEHDPYYQGIELYRGRVRLDCEKYTVLRKTPKGVWIRRWSGSNPETFILDSSPKKVAWPTKKEAAVHFITRKKNQILLLTRQLARAQEALWEAADVFEVADITKPATLKDIYGTATLLGEDEPEDDDNDALLP